VSGCIPAYTAGQLFRTGPAGYKLKTEKGTTFKASHWFDGFSTIHRFDISPDSTSSSSKVTYTSRCTVDQLIRNIEKTGSMDGITFGQKRDPCQSYFKKVMAMFEPSRSAEESREIANIGVTVSINMPGMTKTESVKHASGISSITLKTDARMFKSIDPETLEPIGVASQASLHPDLTGPLSGAHAKSDPKTGDVYNYNLDLGLKGIYKVFCTSASTGKTEIIAHFPGKPAYLHSLFLTTNFVVLCVWNSHLTKGGISVLYNRNIVESMNFDDTLPAKWYVVDRKAGKGLIATYDSPAFYAFHTINAWEETSTDKSENDIFCEVVAYDNLDVIKKFYYENLVSTGPGISKYAGKKGDSARPQFRRYRLPSVPKVPTTKEVNAVVEFSAPKALSMELPTLNPRFFTKRHRYTYGIVDRAKSSFTDGLVKFDSETKSAVYWEEHGHSPGEAIFIPNPDGSEEDDGVLLSVVLDGFRDRSYLLCLDAKTMKEVGKAEVPGVVGFGFHGTHFGNNTAREF
jgi:torulene dioxygenase